MFYSKLLQICLFLLCIYVRSGSAKKKPCYMVAYYAFFSKPITVPPPIQHEDSKGKVRPNHSRSPKHPMDNKKGTDPSKKGTDPSKKGADPTKKGANPSKKGGMDPTKKGPMDNKKGPMDNKKGGDPKKGGKKKNKSQGLITISDGKGGIKQYHINPNSSNFHIDYGTPNSPGGQHQVSISDGNNAGSAPTPDFNWKNFVPNFGGGGGSMGGMPDFASNAMPSFNKPKSGGKMPSFFNWQDMIPKESAESEYRW